MVVPMLRVCFTYEDLLRIRLATSADQLWEIRLSLRTLRTLTGGPLLDSWRREMRARIQHDRILRSAWQFLAPLVPVDGYVPDFLTPTGDDHSVTTGIEKVLSTPRYQLKAELAKLAEDNSVPAHILDLANADGLALKRLGWALGAYHKAAIAPYWRQIQALVRADRAVRVDLAADSGTEGILTGFDAIRWQPPMLQVDSPADRTVRLGGGGLRLIPSLFCQGKPEMLVDSTLPQVLVYPVGSSTTWMHCKPPYASGPQDVRALLGPTRATILECLADHGRFTGELARIVATTPATVSKHTAVLRECGLIISDQKGRNVRHSLTSLGAALLNGLPGNLSPQGKRQSSAHYRV
jgi:DNA-binding transcriptional ArsR family regulator